MDVTSTGASFGASRIRWTAKLVTVAAMMACLVVVSPGRAGAASNPVATENAKAGTTGWILSQPANDLDRQIKGYASSTSVNIGQWIDFFVSVDHRQRYTIDFYRMGWYQGNCGRLVGSSGSLSGRVQTYTPVNTSTGLIEENWSSPYGLRVPSSWVSGVYMAKLTNTDGYQNYVPFVVRDDNRPAPLLYQQSITTDQAYNNFPDISPDNPRLNPSDPTQIGKSLYEGSSHGTNTVAGTTRAVKVSFNRPYADDGSGKFFIWEVNQIRWLERMGYDLAYSTDLDTHQNGGNLIGRKGFISAGHDEYWSTQMRDAVESARNRGVNLAFFGSNSAYWRVRFEPSRTGDRNRTMVSYKDAAVDPTPRAQDKTILFRSLGRPEQSLIGLQYVTYGVSLLGNTPWIPMAQSMTNWVFANTGMASGDQIPGLVGYEIDNLDGRFGLPANQSYTLIASSPYLDANGQTITASSVVYQAPSGAWVFGSGTLSWSWGLETGGDYGMPDARIQKLTQNVLDHYLGLQPALARAAAPLAPDNVGAQGRAYHPPKPEGYRDEPADRPDQDEQQEHAGVGS